MSNSSSDETVDVLIIGAGPVGLTIANELAKRDVGLRIIDKQPEVREISKALIWHVRTQEALAKIGIIDKGLEEAKPLTEVVVRAYGKHIGSWHLEGIDSPYPHPAIIGQNRTQHLLIELLQSRGVEVEWSTEATSVDIQPDGITATIQTQPDADSQTIQAKYVVSCEGSSSIVRKALGLTFQGERYNKEQFIQADCKIKWALPKGRSYLFLTEDGYMMVIEMPNDSVRIFISLPDDLSEQNQAAERSLGAVEDRSHEPTLEEIHQNFVELTGIEVTLSDPTWLARYRTSHRFANRFGVGNAFIAGDSAHVHVPIGGQGMNTGIQDGYNLGWKLAGVAKGIYKPFILDTYNEERHPVAEDLIRGTDIAYRGILNPSVVQQRAARLFGPFVIRQQPVQNFVKNMLEEMTISYPESALNFDCHGTSGPKPGERAPNAVAVTANELETVNLFDLYNQNEWTLLLFGGTRPNAHFEQLAKIASEIEEKYKSLVKPIIVVSGTTLPDDVTENQVALLDADELVHKIFGVHRQSIYLIRPDNIIGFRGGIEDEQSLKAYLGNIFVG